MSPELQDLISRLAQAAKTWHALAQNVSDADILLNDSPNWIAQLTQEAIDGVGSFKAANVKVEDVTATLYILKTMNAIPAATNIAAWVKMANLS